jgi:hypothetical protein
MQLFVPADIEQHFKGLARKDRDAWRKHVKSLAVPSSPAQMEAVAEHYSSPHNSKSLLTIGWKTNSTASILFNHAAPLPDQKELLDMEVLALLQQKPKPPTTKH